MIKPRLQRIARSPAEGTSSLEKRMRLRASSAIQQAVSLSGNGDKISTAWRGGGGGYGWDKPSRWDHPPTPPPVAKLMRRPLPAPPDDPRESSSYLPQASGNQGVLQRLQARLSGAKQTSLNRDTGVSFGSGSGTNAAIASGAGDGTRVGTAIEGDTKPGGEGITSTRTDVRASATPIINRPVLEVTPAQHHQEPPDQEKVVGQQPHRR